LFVLTGRLLHTGDNYFNWAKAYTPPNLVSISLDFAGDIATNSKLRKSLGVFDLSGINPSIRLSPISFFDITTAQPNNFRLNFSWASGFEEEDSIDPIPLSVGTGGSPNPRFILILSARRRLPLFY